MHSSSPCTCTWIMRAYACWLALRPRINLKRCKERWCGSGAGIKSHNLVLAIAMPRSVMGDRSLHCVHRNDLASFDLRSHSASLVSLSANPYLSSITRLCKIWAYSCGSKIIFLYISLLYDIPRCQGYKKNFVKYLPY